MNIYVQTFSAVLLELPSREDSLHVDLAPPQEVSTKVPQRVASTDQLRKLPTSTL